MGGSRGPRPYGNLSKRCAKAREAVKVGIAPGCSGRCAGNWWFCNGGVTFASDVQDPAFAALYGPAPREEIAPNDDWMRHLPCRTCDFMDRYRPSIIWFDGCFNGIEQLDTCRTCASSQPTTSTARSSGAPM
jgi:hypothetical protein